MDIQFRGYRSADKDELLDVYRTIFDADYPQDYLDWTLERNPAGLIQSRLVIGDGRIVGQYAGLPMTMMIDGEWRSGRQIVDTMVAPSYRRSSNNTGIFKTMAESLFDGFARDRLPVAFGFPNILVRNYGRSVLKYKDIGVLTKYVKPLSASVLGGESGRLRRFGGLLFAVYGGVTGLRATLAGPLKDEQIVHVDEFPESVDDIARRILAPCGMPESRRARS